MNKFAYILKRITSMDYKGLFNTVDELHKQSGLSKIRLFFDIIHLLPPLLNLSIVVANCRQYT